MTKPPDAAIRASVQPGSQEETAFAAPAVFLDAASQAEDAAGQAEIVIPVLEEGFSVTKRRVTTGKVKVSTSTVTASDVADVVLERCTVDVTRVPIGRVVEVAPDVRVEGDTTIMPVMEERMVVVKQLVLVEEVHIRRRVEQDTAHEPVTLRKQQVVIERFDQAGRPRDGAVVPD